MQPANRQFQLRLRPMRAARAAPAIPLVVEPQAPQAVGSWRQKLKAQSPQLYEAWKSHDASSARLRRLENAIKLDLPENVELKRTAKAKQARRMREYRAKKKIEQEQERHEPGQEEKKRKTRAESEKEMGRKTKDAERQRLKRASMTTREREAVNRKRRMRRSEQRQELEDLRHAQEEFEAEKAEEAERLRQEEKRLLDEWAKLEAAKNLTPSSSERKRLSRARKSLPKDPLRYAATVSSLITKASPRKKKLLDRCQPQSWAARVAATLATEIAGLHKSRKKGDLKRKRDLAATLKIAKRYRQQKHVCKAFRISRKALQLRTTTAHKRKVPHTTRDSVHSYYVKHSYVLPDKRYVSKKTQQPARFLTVPITTVYCDFRKENPSMKIGISKFSSMRPPHVKLRSAIKYRGCLCEYCTNVELKMDAINRYAHQQHMASPFSSLYNVNNITMCSRGDDKHHRLECIQRKCERCGVPKLRQHLTGLVAEDVHVSWKRWQRETRLHQGKTTSRMVLQEKQAPFSDLMDELEEEAGPFAQHLFDATWQGAQYSAIAKNPPDGCVVMVYDFAENYSCRYQDEIQSVHWGHDSATLHPIVATYRCPTDGCTETVTHSLVMISDDNTHDHHAVHEFTEVAMKQLRAKLPGMSRIVRFSDGAPSQYKSRGPFMDVSYASSDYGVDFQHEFFGSRHGKGPSDSESGVIKRLVTDAVMAGTVVVRNAHDMFQFVRKNATRPAEVTDACCHFQREAFWVQSSEISRNRDRQATKTVVGTRRIHSVRSIAPKVIATRSLSCFCSACMDGSGECHNLMYVEHYTDVSLEHGVTPETLRKSSGEAKRSSGTAPTGDMIPSRQDTATTPNTEDRSSEEEAISSGTASAVDRISSSSDMAAPPNMDNRCQLAAAGPSRTPGTQLKEGTTITRSNPEDSTDDHGVTDECSPKVGDFVRVRVLRLGKKSTDKKFVAKVLGVNADRFHLTYMEQRGDLFTWPSGEECVYIHPSEDISEKLQPPQPVAMGSRIFFKFP